MHSHHNSPIPLPVEALPLTTVQTAAMREPTSASSSGVLVPLRTCKGDDARQFMHGISESLLHVWIALFLANSRQIWFLLCALVFIVPPIQPTASEMHVRVDLREVPVYIQRKLPAEDVARQVAASSVCQPVSNGF